MRRFLRSRTYTLRDSGSRQRTGCSSQWRQPDDRGAAVRGRKNRLYRSGKILHVHTFPVCVRMGNLSFEVSIIWR